MRPERGPLVPPDWRGRLAAAAGAALVRGAAAFRWTVGRPPAGWRTSWALAVLVGLAIGSSTATAGWVPGLDPLGPVGGLAALAVGLLALVRRLPAAVALPLGLVVGIAFYFEHLGGPQVVAGLQALMAGDLPHAGVGALYLLSVLMWVVGGWLAWSVLRWRLPLLGLVPGAAVLATNLLNFPQGQNGFTLEFAALTVALLLWTAYKRSLDDAARRGLRLSSESRWDFWESGAVAGFALLVVAFFAPPLSTVDRTVDAQTGLIKAWADVQVGLHHALPGPGAGAGGPGSFSTGFSDQVVLGHPLKRDTTIVFTYRVAGSHSTTLYFRGLSVPATIGGEWRYLPGTQPRQLLPAGRAPGYAEAYADQQSVTVTVRMLRPPAAAPSVFFYPGQLSSLSHSAFISGDEMFGPVQTATLGGGDSTSVRQAQFATVDRAADNGTTPSSYAATGEYSTATAPALRGAGTDYPGWITPYTSVSAWGADGGAAGPYRPAAVESEIRALAKRVTAGTSDPYDAAAAIENYLRTSFKYTLHPPATPAGQDPLAYFLFTSHQGYCEYFASAMGDMLRALGIPVRLVNGYGPGVYDGRNHQFVVREQDAHTWVEVYFPRYGWVPFEPTPDGVYFPVPRGLAVCPPTNPICVAAPALAGAAGPGHINPAFAHDDNSELQSQTGPPVQRGFRLPFDPLPVALLLLAAILAAALVVCVRLLSPRSAGLAWRRTLLLCRLAGVPAQPGETPLEFGARLARALPLGAAAARRLAEAYTVAAYAPPELAPAAAEDVLAGWQGLRPVLLREAAARRTRRR